MIVSDSVVDKIKKFQHSVAEDLYPRTVYFK